VTCPHDKPGTNSRLHSDSDSPTVQAALKHTQPPKSYQSTSRVQINAWTAANTKYRRISYTDTDDSTSCPGMPGRCATKHQSSPCLPHAKHLSWQPS